eukprot:CAMPEP_0181316196 /NCGR_PEP_ID=MMETSP1101-20121128/15768_1 /TAXON_ID=46948 /ORGANISM="Rhodomonas abbreviata, Strain Caron Lab Isolate" /LENGTH=246 /DNA_ID=CAMNT_0023423431 /DNA_START=177 /DNA_END=917 /DNA_ORIENTATION=-
MTKDNGERGECSPHFNHPEGALISVRPTIRSSPTIRGCSTPSSPDFQRDMLLLSASCENSSDVSSNLKMSKEETTTAPATTPADTMAGAKKPRRRPMALDMAHCKTESAKVPSFYPPPVSWKVDQHCPLAKHVWGEPLTVDDTEEMSSLSLHSGRMTPLREEGSGFGHKHLTPKRGRQSWLSTAKTSLCGWVSEKMNKSKKGKDVFLPSCVAPEDQHRKDSLLQLAARKKCILTKLMCPELYFMEQ